MNQIVQSRRNLFRLLGGAFAIHASGFGSLARLRPSPLSSSSTGGPNIDSHFHLVNIGIPGIPVLPVASDKKTSLPPFAEGKQAEGSAALAKLVETEMKAANTQHALCMPRAEVSDKDPLGIKETEAVADLVRGARLHPVGLAHPERFDRDHLSRVEEVLKQGKVKAFKAYLGYLPYSPNSPNYRPYYRLAGEYDVPIIFHTGDTYSASAKLKYAHPLEIDELAVDFPETKFVIAHFGNPWIMDAAQVAYKNKNVWVEVSGFLIGDEKSFADYEKEGGIALTVRRIRDGIDFVGAPDKFLYGSDWPLAPLGVYRDFVRKLFPEKHHRAVFHDNAKALFKL